MSVDEEQTLSRSIDLSSEQEEIMNQVVEIKRKHRGRGLSWNRFRGDAVSRVVASHLHRHLPRGFKVVRSAWVEGCENEFDLLIVNVDAEPLGFTSAYEKDQVRLIIEVKAAGVFYKREEVEKRLSQLFKEWREKTGKPILYLSIWEAQAHIKEVLRALGEDTAFIFQVEKVGVEWDAWERFLDKVAEVLTP